MYFITAIIMMQYNNNITFLLVFTTFKLVIENHIETNVWDQYYMLLHCLIF